MAESNPTQVILTDDGIKIIKAQNTANNAAGDVDNLNDPNLLSVIEKSQLKIQMDNFATIYTADKDIATSEGIDFTAYDAAYQAYLNYMTPLIADITTYSPIVRATFNSMVTAVQAEQKRFNVATQAQYNQQINKAQNDISDGQTKYKDLLSEARAMESSAAGISDAADRAISTAGFASNDASTANQAASSALASALNAQNDASSAVIQASSAASDSKDAKQIAGAVSQSYKTLTDGSTMTIAELQNGLAAKLTKTDLNGYATQDWAQNQIKFTADGINGTISSIKGTVDSHTTSINTLQADSKKFKAQFTTYKDTVDRHDKDISTLKASSKSLSAHFDSLSSNNKTNQHDIGQLQVSAKEFNNTLTTVQTQVQNSAVGTNLYRDTRDFDSPDTWNNWNNSYKTGEKFNGLTVMGTKGDWAGLGQTLQAKKGEVYTLSVYARYESGTGTSSIFFQQWNTGNTDPGDVTVPLNETWQRVKATVTMTADGPLVARIERTANNTNTLLIAGLKLEKGSIATDYSVNPEDTATVTAVSKILQTVNGFQTTVSDKVSSSQLTELSGQLTNQIKDLSSKTDSSFKQTASDINGRVKKGDVVNQFNIDAGGALLSTSGNSTKIVFSSPNIIFDSNNPVQIPNANIPGKLTGKTIESSTITATTKITGSDIEAPLVHSPSGSFKLDGNTGDIIGASIHSANNSWRIDKDGNINGVTINGSTINGTTFNAGTKLNQYGNTSYPLTINQDGSVTSTSFGNIANDPAALRTVIKDGSVKTNFRGMKQLSTGIYPAADIALGAGQLALLEGYSTSQDPNFTATGMKTTGYAILDASTGLSLHGTTQEINFSGTDQDQTTGIVMNSYGNIIGKSNSTWWRIVSNAGSNVANFGIDSAGSNVIQFNRELDIGNFHINTGHTFTSADNGDIHFAKGKGGAANIYAGTVHYNSLTKSSLLSVKKDVKKADTAYWAQLVNAIDLATYQYKTDDNTSHLRLSSIVDDVNDTKQWQLPDIFISRDEDGKLCGVDDSVLLNATLATVQEQQKEIDQLNGHNMELEARLNKLEAKLNG
ncbi:phage tail protein [Lactiplantibacillus plantarum]|nr:phage tail protein [Lactiplantibacillus plantarum]